MSTYKCTARIEMDLTVEAKTWEEARQKVIAAMEHDIENGTIPNDVFNDAGGYPQLVDVLPLSDGTYHLHGLNHFAREVHEEATIRRGWASATANAERLLTASNEIRLARRERAQGKPPAYVYSGAYSEPCGVPINIADCMLALLDYCAKHGIDIEKRLAEMRRYNNTPMHERQRYTGNGVP